MGMNIHFNLEIDMEGVDTLLFQKEKLKVRKLVEMDIQIVSKWLSNPAVLLLPKNEWHEGEYRDCWLMEFRI